MNRTLTQFLKKIILIVAVALSFAAGAQQQPAPKVEGVDAGKPSQLASLVPAKQLEQQSALQYDQLKRQAASQQALAPANHPQVKRLRAIAAKIIPLTPRFNPRATEWNWEINLIGSKEINAFCMPGGKIAFFTGILNNLKLTDDEVAIVMGHEIAHALREHARARIAKGQLTNIGANVLGLLIGGGKYTDAFRAGGSLLTLKFSRDDESEADGVGLDLAARAGYDPRAGISVWQKMGAASRGGPPQWLSTHPSGPSRIKEIERLLPQVMPLFAKATGRKLSEMVPYPGATAGPRKPN